MNKILTLSLVLLLSACGQTVLTPAKLTEKSFPQVRGESLKKQEVIIPDAYRGKLTAVLVGYQQKAQFDIDRWILGLLQAEVPVEIVEVPTIAGMMPQMVQGFINDGMRKGIPEEDWASVVTVFGDASKIIEAIGNERPQNAHALLLDRDGKIIWSSNRGYSAQQILELKELALKIKG